jgi:hypothetical protein
MIRAAPYARGLRGLTVHRSSRGAGARRQPVRTNVRRAGQSLAGYRRRGPERMLAVVVDSAIARTLLAALGPSSPLRPSHRRGPLLQVEFGPTTLRSPHDCRRVRPGTGLRQGRPSASPPTYLASGRGLAGFAGSTSGHLEPAQQAPKPLVCPGLSYPPTIVAPSHRHGVRREHHPRAACIPYSSWPPSPTGSPRLAPHPTHLGRPCGAARDPHAGPSADRTLSAWTDLSAALVVRAANLRP